MPAVRNVRPDEWRELRALRLRMLTTDPQAFASTLADAEALAEEEWQARTAERDDRVVLVVDDLLGIAVGLLTDATVEVRSMWVAPERRGEGLGRALLGAVIVWAGERGATRAELEVNPSQAAAVALYESAGFVCTGRDGPFAASGCACVQLALDLR